MSSLKPGLTHNANSLKILMVSTEYPPMNGGVGRYTSNLTRELNKFGLQYKFFPMKMDMVIFLGYHQRILRIIQYY